MIVLPGGGCLFEMTSFPSGVLVNVVVVGPALSDSETEEEGNQSSPSDKVFHRQPPLAIGLLSQEAIEQCRCR